MLVTIGGKTLEVSIGPTTDSPSFTLSWILLIAFATTTLPAVSRVILSAWRMGTPLLIRVPNVRAKREMAVLLVKSPKTGIRNAMVSRNNVPPGVLDNAL